MNYDIGFFWVFLASICMVDVDCVSDGDIPTIKYSSYHSTPIPRGLVVVSGTMDRGGGGGGKRTRGD